MKAIFFGNGLNRVDNHLDWGGLLEKIALDKALSAEIPNTLQYEAIFLSRKIGASIGRDKDMILKKEIAKELQDVKTNDIYTELVAAPVSEYITINYDATLEKALIDADFCLLDKDFSESTYNIHRFRRYKKGELVKRVWYIHGEITKLDSIMIGYNHYCGSLARIYGYIKGTYALKKNAKKVLPMVRKMNEKREKVESWIDLFFMSDVHFIGARLSYDEIDIWWLLNMRARMIDEGKIKKHNEIFFYEPKESNESKKILLDRFKVIPKGEELNSSGDFKSFYISVVKGL